VALQLVLRMDKANTLVIGLCYALSIRAQVAMPHARIFLELALGQHALLAISKRPSQHSAVPVEASYVLAFIHPPSNRSRRLWVGFQ